MRAEAFNVLNNVNFNISAAQQLQNIKLEKLKLYNCYITDFGRVKKFLKDSQLSSIKELDLRLNWFENKDVVQLEANKAFRGRDIEILIVHQ